MFLIICLFDEYHKLNIIIIIIIIVLIQRKFTMSLDTSVQMRSFFRSFIEKRFPLKVSVREQQRLHFSFETPNFFFRSYLQWESIPKSRTCITECSSTIFCCDLHGLEFQMIIWTTGILLILQLLNKIG